jgi:hypothetical protein
MSLAGKIDSTNKEIEDEVCAVKMKLEVDTR